jgi:hypothetical protein
MKCEFCDTQIHFDEDFLYVSGAFFHEAVITPTSVRCKRRLTLNEKS